MNFMEITMFLIVILMLLFAAFSTGMMFATPPQVEKGIEMTAAESCNSLIKSVANGMYDPWTGLMIIRTDGRFSKQVEHTILHELGHFYNGMDENLAENYAVNHKIVEVLK